VKEKKKRTYNGPARGSPEAKAQMEKVRAAQWARHGLMMQNNSSGQAREG
jgi:hypothetical protein